MLAEQPHILMEGLMNWCLFICWCCVSQISAHGTLFSAFYGPSRPPGLTLSSTVTTSASTSSSTPQYPTPTLAPQTSSDDPVLSTIYVTTLTPKTITANETSTTTPLTYPNISISTLTSTASLSQSANPTDFHQQLDTSLEPERNITASNSTSVWSTTSSTATVVENVSKTNQQFSCEDDLDALGGLISGSVVGVFILLLACIAVCIFVGHRRNTMHEVRPEDDHHSLFVNNYMMAPPSVYKL